MVQEKLTPGIGLVRAWLAGVGGAQKSHYFVYHRGHLEEDRGRWVVAEGNQVRWVVAEEVNKVAELMWAAYERGEVVLVQRRVGPGDWLYIAQRSLRMRRTL